MDGVGKFRRKDQQSVQEELWLRAQELVRGPQDGFYARLNAALVKTLFTESVHRHCAPHYKAGGSTGGSPPVDPAAVERFDCEREGRKTSNKEWYNPYDPDAKIGRTKGGACDMVHKPEHGVDLDSGAIVAAEVRPGDAGDTRDPAKLIIEAVDTVEEVYGEPPGGEDLTGWGTPKQTAAAGKAFWLALLRPLEAFLELMEWYYPSRNRVPGNLQSYRCADYRESCGSIFCGDRVFSMGS